jgi:predicted N-formylglutamate amidohydrolase
MGSLGLDHGDLERHIAYDIGTAEVARILSDRFDAPLVMSGYSRLIIDPNRYLGAPTSIPLASEDVVIPGNHDLTPEEVAQRVESFFLPYHDAVTGVLNAYRARGAVPGVVSIHSFTPAFLGQERPWHVSILWDKDGRIALPLLERLRADPHLCVGDNEPYSARNPEGYSLATHAEAEGHPHVLIEIRQDLIDTKLGATNWAERVGDALADVMADPTLYTVS